MVQLTRIYTRTGDQGDTRLSDMSKARKTDPRVRAYGDVDEANSIIGLALSNQDMSPDVAAVLAEVQNELFDVGADLSNPVVEAPRYEPLRVIQDSIDRLESWCDEYGQPLPELKSFILPGGTPTGALLHLARTVVRRAERSAWEAAETYGVGVPDDADAPGGVNLLAVTYLNRLSDLLFIFSRVVNTTDSEVLWVPGKDREPVDARSRRQRERIERARSVDQNAVTGETGQT